jgi:hypothetical protein
MVKGTLRADALVLMEITHASFLAGSANPKMRARVAFVRSESGATLGYTDHENWSKETLQQLAALRQSMEEDVAQLYLEQGSPTTTGGGVPSSSPQGLGEYLNTGEAPSV